jgi:uncharacterized protein YdaU (DUF1376 family)
MLDNGGPLLDDDASDPKMRWVKVSPHELLEGIAELNMEERGYYMTMFFTMYARMGGMPFDEREGAKILRVDIRMYRRLRDRMVALGKLHVDDGELKNARTEYEITEYARKIRRLKDAAAERVAKRREQVSLTRKLAKVAEDIRQTSPELPGDFSQKFPGLQGKSSTKSMGAAHKSSGNKNKNKNKIQERKILSSAAARRLLLLLQVWTNLRISCSTPATGHSRTPATHRACSAWPSRRCGSVTGRTSTLT